MIKRSLLARVALLALSVPATAQLMVSGNDAKARLVDRVNTVVADPPPDTVTIHDLASLPPRLTPASEAPIGAWAQGAAFSADDRTLLA